MRSIVKDFGAVLALLALWWTASLSSRGFIPDPASTISVLWDANFARKLLEAYAATAVRALTGYAIGLALGLTIGLVATALRVYALLEPLAAVVASVPSVAWIPILIAIFGVDEFRLPVLAALMCALPPILYEVFHAVSSIDPEEVGVARLLGAKGFFLWRSVILPNVVERIFPAAKVEAVMVWKTVFAAEMIAMPSGLGYLAILYADMLDLKHLLVVVGVLTATVAAVIRILSFIEAKVLSARGVQTWNSIYA